MTEKPELRIVVDPRPTPEEMAAISAAVLTLAPKPPEPDEKSQSNPWRDAARREAMRGDHRE